MASASGWSLRLSSDSASESKSPDSTPKDFTSVTTGRPSVTVPVLSMMTAFTLCRFSSASADWNSTPFFAPTPVPTMIATGVASPSAHGHEITSTEIARVSAKLGVSPTSSQMIAVTSAIPITTGTNTPATLSASLAIGALEAPASSTRRIIWLRVVSSPTRNAFMTT